MIVCVDCGKENNDQKYFCQRCGYNLVNGKLFKEMKPKTYSRYEKAYFLWEKAGRPEGRDLEFWLKAA